MSNPPNGFNTNSNFNKFKGTYFNSDVDVSGGNIICRTGNVYLKDNSAIYSPSNTITFSSNGFVNFGNSYFGSAVYIFNPTTSSNIDVVAYVNANDSNITSINSSITTANSGISSNTSAISTINGKIGTLGWDSIYDFTTVNNLFINPGGTIQYEDASGNHPDLIPAVIANTSNITTLQTKTSAQGYNSGTTTTSFAGIVECNVVSFLTSINGISTTVFGYISGLTSSAQTQISARVDKTSAETISGVKTFSSNMRLDGSLLLNAGVLTITNATLQKIQFLSTVSSDIQTQVTSLSTKLTNLTFSTPTTSISGTTQLATANVSGNLRLDGSLLLNAGVLTITNSTLQKIQFLSTVSSDIQTQTTTLQTKLTNLTFSTPTTSISGTTQLATANVSGNLRLDGSLLVGSSGATTITNTQLTYLSTLSSNVQTQLSSMVSLSANNTYTGTQTYNNNITFSGTLNNKSATTFGYLDATSSIQTQIDNKANLTTTNNFTGVNTFTNQLASTYNNSGTIYGTQTEMFLTGHRSWPQGGAASLGSNVFEISCDTGFYNRGATFCGGASNTVAGSGTSRSIFGIYFRTPAGGGVDPTRTAIMYSTDQETVNGSIDNTLTIPSSLRMYGDLKLFSGNSITNTQLDFLTTLSENVQSAVNTLKTKLTDLVWTSGSPNVTSIVNTTQTATLTFSNTLNGISTGVFGYLSGCTSSIQTQLNNIVSSVTTVTNRQQIGSIMQHPKGNIGSPYLLANGQAVSRTTYSVLFASYGTLYGSGDGSTTFNLPNFQACFLRSYGAGVTIGSSTYSTAAVGSAQNDAIQGHNHSGQSGQFLSTSTSSASVNGYASLAVVKPTASNFGNTGGVINANSGSETVPTHHVIYTYILAL